MDRIFFVFSIGMVGMVKDNWSALVCIGFSWCAVCTCERVLRFLGVWCRTYALHVCGFAYVLVLPLWSNQVWMDNEWDTIALHVLGVGGRRQASTYLPS